MNTLRLLPLLGFQGSRVFLVVLAVLWIVAWPVILPLQIVFPGIGLHQLVDLRHIVCKSSVYRIFNDLPARLHLLRASFQSSSLQLNYRSRRYAATLIAC